MPDRPRVLVFELTANGLILSKKFLPAMGKRRDNRPVGLRLRVLGSTAEHNLADRGLAAMAGPARDVGLREPLRFHQPHEELREDGGGGSSRRSSSSRHPASFYHYGSRFLRVGLRPAHSSVGSVTVHLAP